MTLPTNLTIDMSICAAYLEYAPGPSVETIDLTETGSVAYDLDASGGIIGIEILSIEDAGDVEVARAFAQSKDLAFPRDLAGALVAA